MNYKVYIKGNACVPYNKGSKCIWRMRPSKHRSEIETYFSNMSEPTLTDNGNGTVTLSFTPVPREMATWMVESKSVGFHIVRQNIGNRTSRTHKNDARTYKRSCHTVDEYFPYEWDYVSHQNDPTIANGSSDQLIRRITVNELVSGQITRNISHLYDYRYSNSFSQNRTNSDFIFEFYLGLIYWNADNMPTLYKMGKLEVSSEDMNML